MGIPPVWTRALSSIAYPHHPNLVILKPKRYMKMLVDFLVYYGCGVNGFAMIFYNILLALIVSCTAVISSCL